MHESIRLSTHSFYTLLVSADRLSQQVLTAEARLGDFAERHEAAKARRSETRLDLERCNSMCVVGLCCVVVCISLLGV